MKALVARFVRVRRWLALVVAAAALAAPLAARAQVYPPFALNVTLGVPVTQPVTIPLEFTVAQLSAVSPGTVLFSTADPVIKGILNLLSPLFGDGSITASDVSTVYPNGKITINGFSATLTGDARFGLNASACAAPSGNTCTANVSYNGAGPTGLAVLTINGSAVSATLSGTNASLEPYVNALLPTVLASVPGFTTFTVNVSVKATQTIIFDTAPTIAVGTTGTVSATGGASGNPIVFTRTTPSTCSITGTTVTGLAAGTCTITADQAGNANYFAAPQVTQSFAIGKGSQTIAFGTAPASVAVGTTGTVSATGGPSGNAVVFASTTPGTCSISGATVTGLGAGTCTISANQAGNTNYNAAPQVTQSFSIAKGSQAIVFGTAPSGITVGTMGSVSATGGPSGSPVVFASTTPTTCSILAATVTGIAAGTCIISANQAGNTNYNAAPQVTQSFPIGADQNPPRMLNISTRMQVLTGDDVMIGGFVIGGSATKRVAIIATGPSLAPFGIANPLADPTLRLVRSSDQAVLATNDNWQATANVAQLQAAGLAPTSPLEAAIIADLAPGAYTAIVEGVSNGTGVAVVAAYEVGSPTVPLINISTRGRVLTGNDVMIGGFVITGSGSQTVVITGTGPSLANFGISSPLANPTLTLMRSSDQAVLATNDDWQSSPNLAQIQAAGLSLTHPLESAIYATLPPGAYTAILSGVGGGTGVGVIGVYKVGP